VTSLFSVKDKTVVITGGSGYLGSEWCRVFEEEGARVHDWDLQTMDLREMAEVVEEVETIKHIDVLICGAASNAPHNYPYDRYPNEDFVQELHNNIATVQNSIQAVAPLMMEKRSGSIILISSELALIGPNNNLYSDGEFKDLACITSKTALLGLMRGWASYLGPYGVRVNALCPGGVINKQSTSFVVNYGKLNMLGYMAQKYHFNGALIFLASNASSFMTGATLVVDGGRTAW